LVFKRLYTCLGGFRAFSFLAWVIGKYTVHSHPVFLSLVSLSLSLSLSLSSLKSITPIKRLHGTFLGLVYAFAEKYLLGGFKEDVDV
jgi:hypothetical protein